MGYIERKYDGKKEDTFDGYTEGFIVVTYNYESLVSLESTMIGVSDYSKVGE